MHMISVELTFTSWALTGLVATTRCATCDVWKPRWVRFRTLGRDLRNIVDDEQHNFDSEARR